MIIFGAQGYAISAYDAISTLYPGCHVHFFMVTSIKDNPISLRGLSVKEIDDVSVKMTSDEKLDIEVLIATPENVQPVIEQSLIAHGFKNIKKLDFNYYSWLMDSYHRLLGRFLPLSSNPNTSELPDLRIYMAKSHVDRPLKESYGFPEYYSPIQVGASNTDSRIADLTDDIGDSISEKNYNYCELTGLYWIWKNVLLSNKEKGNDNCYYGYCQYRRMMIFSESNLAGIKADDVDAVLPYPLVYEPSIEEHHKRYLKEVDWNTLVEALKVIHPESVDCFFAVMAQKYMFNYNVILAKKKVLQRYCEWLFPLLQWIEENSVPKGCERRDRYLGYMAETLETFFFLTNDDGYKLRYSPCKLLV